MDLSGGTIYFISEKKIRENRTFFRFEFLRAGIINVSSNYVGWKKVRRELNPAKLSLKSLRESIHSEGFGPA